MPQVEQHGTVLAGVRWRELDLSPASDFFDSRDWADPVAVATGLRDVLGNRTVVCGYTPHLGSSMLFTARRRPGRAQPATVQLGVGLLVGDDQRIMTPIAAEVVRVGPTELVLRHQADDGPEPHRFWTRWLGITPTVITGAFLSADADIGTAVAPSGDSTMGAVVHVQVLLGEDLVDNPPPLRVAPAALQDWLPRTADPAPVLGIADELDTRVALKGAEIIALRDRRLGRSQRAYYREPPNFVRGRGVWLYDEYGLGYLDAINNVSHVGHSEPRITQVATRQLSKLNTNSRFVYEGIATYAERIVSTLPAPLEVVFFVCTGSEANDLALRMARQVTGRTHVAVIDGAYHGNTAAVMGISPNRYKGTGGRGAPPTTHEVMRPDVYRGPYGQDDSDAGRMYAAEAANVISELEAQGQPPAAFIAESLMGTAGIIIFPDGYLKGAFQATRAAGGLCISDEVQVGVGRLGSHPWGFQAQGVVPDIVTMGKPLGNGHPIAAVVTTREIADAFDDGVKYFNTFGGNPVSCAIGTAVLDIVERDGLQDRARVVGGYFLDSLHQLMSRHELIGDVRGHGLYLGIELVSNRDTKEPAVAEALQLSEQMKDHGIVVYPTGAFDNVLKLKPPMTFGKEHVDLFVETLDHVLANNPLN